VVLACDQGHPVLVRRGCDDRSCPDCQPRLARRMFVRVRRGAEKARENGCRLAHVGFSVPNVHHLDGAVLDGLHRAFSALWRQRPVQRWLAGLYRHTEVTFSEERGWHPHLHALAALRPGWVDYGELERSLAMRWHRQTGCTADCPDKLASLDHRRRRRLAKREAGDAWDGVAWDAGHPAPSGCTRGGSVWLGDVLPPGADPDEAVHEVCKYVVKPLAVQAADGPPGFDTKAAEVAIAIRKRRLGQGYGVFFRLPKDDEPAPACCRTCERHNERVRAAFAAGTDPGPDPELADPDAGYVDTALRYEGSPRQVWRRAAGGDERSGRILARLRTEHPELWGAGAPPDS